MLTGNLKSKIDRVWLEFHSGGITNPLTVIEQISYLMYLKLLDSSERLNERKSRRGGKADFIFGEDKKHLRWHQFMHIEPQQMLNLVRDEVFKFIREEITKKTAVGHFMANAQCLIPTGTLMAKAVALIDDLPLENSDTKGDIYEYMLGKLSTAGIAGQFRTPRHIIRAMVAMTNPQPTDSICDPACGTAGFLTMTMEYLKEQHTSPELIEDALDDDGKPILDRYDKPMKTYLGDQLVQHKDHVQQGLLTGFDFDITMLRIAAMNLLLHGIQVPGISQMDTLSQSFADNAPTTASDAFTLILANPPFKGAVDENIIDSTLTQKVKTKKTELLFIVLMLRMLKEGGRCAVVVPDGVLFGSSKAHTAVRKLLIEEHGLEAVVSLPSGVFRPYAGVQTGILFFTKGSQTRDVWFYKVNNDGFSLDDRRNPVPEDDLPDLVSQWKKYNHGKGGKHFQNRASNAFVVPKADIVAAKYNLAVNTYQEVPYEAPDLEAPEVILERLEGLEAEIATDLKALKGML